MSPRRARAALTTALALTAALPAVALAGDPILPFTEVRPGMVGEARTVVQGTEIVTFPVRIFDRQQVGDSPGGALILARAEGPLIESTGGVAQGMSGSPVYVTGEDGVARVIGAIAYGAGDQAGLVIGITPIEQMLRSSAGNRFFEVRSVRAAREAVRVRSRAAAVALERRRPDHIGLHPLGRVSVAGVSRPLARLLGADLERRGLQATGIGPRTPRPPQELVPGSTMTALLAGGDITVGSVGTTTYIDGNRVLGFGHPFLGSGRARLLLGDGYVYQTIAAPISGQSYKLAEPGTIQGAVIGDRADGVTAVRGPSGGIPARSVAIDTTRGTRVTVRATLAPDERTLPIVATVLQGEPLARARDGLQGGTVRLTLRISSPVLARPLVHRNVFAAYGDILAPGIGELNRALALLTQNGLSSIPVGAVEVEQVVESRVRAARLVSARTEPRVVRPGQRVTLVLRMQPWRASVQTVRVPIRIPGGLAPGPRALRVVPNTGTGFDAAPAPLEELLGASQGLATRADVAAMERLATGLPGPRTRRVVAAVLASLGGRNDAVRILGPGETRPDQGQVVRVPHVIHGPRTVVRFVVAP